MGEFQTFVVKLRFSAYSATSCMYLGQLTAVVLMRDVCLVLGGFYKRYQTMEAPHTMQRFFNPEVSSMQVIPTLMSKVREKNGNEFPIIS